MMPASTKQAGQCVVPGPADVCKTPTPGGPVPMPYPNIAMCVQANGESSKVKISGAWALTVNSKIPMSSGDEPGTVGGVISNLFKGEVHYKKGSSKVKIQGKAAVHVTSLTGHNGSNANMPAGLQAVPSQATVLVAM
jgi:hypothetical protein